MPSSALWFHFCLLFQQGPFIDFMDILKFLQGKKLFKFSNWARFLLLGMIHLQIAISTGNLPPHIIVWVAVQLFWAVAHSTLELQYWRLSNTLLWFFAESKNAYSNSIHWNETGWLAETRFPSLPCWSVDEEKHLQKWLVRHLGKRVIFWGSWKRKWRMKMESIWWSQSLSPNIWPCPDPCETGFWPKTT